jgi:hypothetical protein
MAVEAFKSNHNDGVSRLEAVDRSGKYRVHNAKMQAITVAGDDGSTIALGSLPAGRVRVMPNDIKTQSSAFGASRVLKIGHRAYAKADGTVEAEDDDAFAASIDIAAAGVDASGSANLSFDIYSRAGVELFATVTGGTIPIGATLEVNIPYITD